MTPQESLQVLDQATATLEVNRADHQLIAKAIGILADVVNKDCDCDDKDEE